MTTMIFSPKTRGNENKQWTHITPLKIIYSSIGIVVVLNLKLLEASAILLAPPLIVLVTIISIGTANGTWSEITDAISANSAIGAN